MIDISDQESYKGRRNICGTRIREEREKRGLSQADLCKLLKPYEIDFDSETLAFIESHQRTVADFELIFIAMVLQVDPSDLLEP